ncbi:putative trichohyalin-like [Scophthalmus maximus]|uniref:Putative trichohyalin-like n=1 Tax=Scophthalmus maximus TaxID=52904 RepID=A0A2U9B9L1_SCOMX|nr:putative trichohyalin-like [Scophthalmus maximus]
MQPEEFKHQRKRESPDEVDPAEKMSKRDCLRKIWKDTKKERQEIDHMKCRGHEIRNHLEKRLAGINQFVKRAWLQKGKAPQDKTNLEQGTSENTTSKSYWETDQETLDDKYTELHQLKVRMLCEIEKLHIKEAESKTLTTCDKSYQTSQVDATMGNEAVQATQQASTKTHREQMVQTSQTSSGLLSQLRHYCYRCCCPCPCCRQVCREEE